jgi:predicted ribosomally synthesized peptide with SipW-like signal peptide
VKKILMICTALLLTVGLVGAGTFAFFSDTETSLGNTFTAGTLDLNLDGGNVNVVKFNVTNAAPGGTGGATWTLANVGTLAGFLDLESISVFNAGGLHPEPEWAPDPLNLGHLGTYMNIHLFIDVDNDGISEPGDTTIYMGALSGLAASYALNHPLVASGGTAFIRLNWWIPATVGNWIMGDTATLSITFELAQTAGQ